MDLIILPAISKEINLPEAAKKGLFFYAPFLLGDKFSYSFLGFYTRIPVKKPPHLKYSNKELIGGYAMAAKYLIIARELEQQLHRGQGEKLPTEAALCQQYQVSRQTVRSALGVLEEKGLILRRQGSGAYPTQAAVGANRQIAVVLEDKEEYLAPALLREIRKAASQASCSVLCLETRGNRDREGELLERLLHQRPAGIILAPITDVLGCFREELLEKIRAAGIPLVYLGGRYDTQAPAVLFDDVEGAGMLMTRLATAGHRKAAAILKWDEFRGQNRFRALCRWARELNLQFGEESCLWYSQQERLGLLEGDEELLHRFQERFRRDCTAVVCFNDEIGYRMQRYLKNIHDPMSVVCFEGSYLALAQDAALTVLTPSEDLPGSAAVRLIMEQMEGKSAQDILLPWRLNARKSG